LSIDITLVRRPTSSGSLAQNTPKKFPKSVKAGLDERKNVILKRDDSGLDFLFILGEERLYERNIYKSGTLNLRK
jgi:hypothetical protein